MFYNVKSDKYDAAQFTYEGALTCLAARTQIHPAVGIALASDAGTRAHTH